MDRTGELCRIGISKSERKEALALARSLGMTFQGFLGKLVKDALAKEQVKAGANE